MNERWNLNPIYTGFDDPAFEADLASLKQKVAAFAAFSEGLADTEPAEGLRQGIALEEEIVNLVNKLAEYASLRQSADSRDPEAGSQMGGIMPRRTRLSGTGLPSCRI